MFEFSFAYRPDVITDTHWSIRVITVLIDIHCGQANPVSGMCFIPREKKRQFRNQSSAVSLRKPCLQMKQLLAALWGLVFLFHHSSSSGRGVRLCSRLSHSVLMPLLFRPSDTILVMNFKHRGEDHELGQENVINNLDKYGDGLGRIKERVGGKEVETINRLDLLLPC